jgi:hypothetical protein
MQKIGAPIRLRIAATVDMTINPLTDYSSENLLLFSNFQVSRPGPLFAVIDAPMARLIGPANNS